MIYDYFPGCTLKNDSALFDLQARLAAERLGFSLLELPEWQCCGGVYPMATNENGAKLPAARALTAAKENGRELAAVCSACYHVLKSVNYDMKYSSAPRDKINAYSENDPPYAGETKVVHFLEIIRDRLGFDALKKAVTNPLSGVKIAPFYGCLILRPSEVMGFDNSENPSVMEDFISALGGEPVRYPFRNECCGGYMALEDKALTEKKSAQIVSSAVAHGAELIITPCPLCLYNLKKISPVPVMFFTQPLCRALGIEVAEND